MKGGILGCVLVVASVAAYAADGVPLAETERLFLEFLDARDASAYLETGHADAWDGARLETWNERLRSRHRALTTNLATLDTAALPPSEQAALAAIRVTLADFGEPEPAAAAEYARAEPRCGDRHDRTLDFAGLSAALRACFREIGNNLQFEGRTIDRGNALGLWSDLEEPARRKALTYAFHPLWTALNGENEPDSPYRRLLKLAAAEEATNGSGIAAAARAIGVTVDDVENWLVQILAAWRDVNPPELIEPWDYRHAMGEANRRLAPLFPPGAIITLNDRFYRDLGVDLAALGVVYDIKDRPGQSPLAYCDFLRRGRRTETGAWQPTIARVVGRYEEGGLGSLNELVHENGHATHISGIRNRPAFTDWTDTLFTEAFADVTSWSVYEPAWQQKYLGTELPLDVSLRGLYGAAMLDVAWSLFELRLLRDPALDPNALWTDITREYLHIVPHPELSWWAVRVQLADPGYMVNYGLGSVLTAEMRRATAAAIGPFDAGNLRWHDWTREQLLQYGSEKSSRQLMDYLLGRPLSPAALLAELNRIK
jgi:hypothetical protein